jgi:7-cyano-7-deazaguanine synthase in queuosine biosynthesis
VILPPFTYRVDARGAVYQVTANGVDRQDQLDVSSKSAQLFVDGVQRPQGWLSNFGQAERDLLRVAAAVLDLDRLSLRRPRNTKNEKRELHWRRAITAEIGVEDPARWCAVSEYLHALLSFLTDDIWTFTFVQGERFREQCVLFAPGISADAEIALFSGGLDSSVGLLARHRQKGGSVVTVSAVGNEVRRRAQDAALQAVRTLGVAIAPISIDHQLKDADGALEITQRSRGLFFLAIGAAVASQIGNRQFHVYETGVGCLNIPTSAAQIASQATRAMHPHTLAMFNDLVARVLDRPARVVAPFFFMTKGELCGLIRDDLCSLAKNCSSCDEGDGHKLDPMEHCGLCTSCMFRRVAIMAAGTSDPMRYRDVPARLRHNSYELAAFEYHASELSRVSTFEDLTDLDPNVRFVLRAPTGTDVTADVVRSQTVRMYRQYAAEIRCFLAAARPTLRSRDPHPAKEVTRDLFAATR